jgi:NAD+ synthase (glutamine-hydrolysing)
VALEVCEDLWSVEGPLKRRSYSGAELNCNVSSSPYRLGVVQTRRELIATRAADHGVTIAYANAVGANDGLIFDGGGVGQPKRQARCWTPPRWREGFAAVTVDLDRTSRLRTENSTWRLDQEAWAWTAQPVPVVAIPSSALDTAARPRPADLPGARLAFLLPDGAARRPIPGPVFCEDICSTRWRWASADYSRRIHSST